MTSFYLKDKVHLLCKIHKTLQRCGVTLTLGAHLLPHNLDFKSRQTYQQGNSEIFHVSMTVHLFAFLPRVSRSDSPILRHITFSFINLPCKKNNQPLWKSSKWNYLKLSGKKEENSFSSHPTVGTTSIPLCLIPDCSSKFQSIKRKTLKCVSLEFLLYF